MESKELAYILRHHPEEFNLTPDEYGWVSVPDLLKNCKITQQKLDEIVEDNTRFFYDPTKKFIRAAHGHSYPVKPIPTNDVPPHELFHGTATRFMDSINSTGIKSMSRAYVHLSQNESTAKTIGSRHGKPVVIVLDVDEMLKDGYEFYKSEDGVWLTSDIDPKYFKEIK